MIVLPKAPNAKEKYAYIYSGRIGFYSLGIISFLLLVTGMWLFSTSHPYFYVYSLFAFGTTFYLSLSYLVGVFSSDFDIIKHEALILSYWEKSKKFGISKGPAVDIFLPCCGEDLSIIENTYRGVSALRMFESLPVKVYVLDDGWDDGVKYLAAKYGFEYIRRPNKGEMKKAGNLRYAFAQTSGDLIAIFDADFVPRFDFLRETVPYFSNSDVAIVQTPQFFSIESGQTWIEKGAAYIQELFYRLIQVNRDHFNGAICVGTCAVYRRSALEPFGGTANIAYSEDVHTGFNCVKNGWKIKYLPINLSKGVCPNTLPSFFMQQYRWAMGSLTLFGNKDFWRSNLTVWQKICYLSGMLYYSATGLTIFLSPIPAALLVWGAPQYIMLHNAIFSVPSFLFGIFFMASWTHAKFGWYGPKIRMVSYFSHLFAIVDKLRGSLVPWQSTGSVKGSKRFEDFRKLIFWWTTVSTLVVTIGISYRISEYGIVNFIPMIFFTAYNYWLCMSILRDQ